MLLYIYCLLSLLAAVFIPLQTGISLLWALLLFPGCFVGCWVLHALFLSAAALFVDKKQPDEKRFGFYRRVIYDTLSALLKLGRVKLKVLGKELLPKEGGFLLVSNHVSLFDPLVSMTAFFSLGLTFVTKKENVSLPVLGALMMGAGCLSLDRDNDRQGALVIRAAARRILNGEAIGIYPEGTRSKTGELGPFRNGAFKAALWSNSPLVVLKVSGTESLKKRFFIKASEVLLEIRRVFPYGAIAEKNTQEIGEEVRQLLR